LYFDGIGAATVIDIGNSNSLSSPYRGGGVLGGAAQEEISFKHIR
jgi:hypothetical protein